MPLVDTDLEAVRSETENIDFDGKSSDQNITASLDKSRDASTSEPSKKRKASSFEEDSGSRCDRCNSITGEIAGLRSLTSREGFKHLSLPALKQSAAAGCASCFFFLNHFRKIPRKWDDDSVFYFRDRYHSVGNKFEHRKGMDEAKFYSELLFLHERFGTLEVFFESSSILENRITSLFLFAAGRSYISLSLWLKGNSPGVLLDHPASQFVEMRPMRTDVSSDGSFRHARYWIEVCEAEHSKCPGSKPPILPTRLIKIEDQKLGGGVRLYVSRIRERAHYAALSYCWGGSQSFTLTASSLASCLEGIIATDLPQTIQDAIKTTQKLGFKFLWVDALCIVQDCPSDKAREITQMGGIYKNATVTIAAANASSASQGFLGSRPSIPSCELPFFRPPSFRSTKGQNEMRGPGKVWLAATATSHDGDEPLYQRAWTLQERLLSPRMLLFGGRELTWQCQQKSTQSIGHTFYRRKTGSKRLPVGIFIYKKQGRREQRLQVQVDLWISIVEDYSRRNLSFREDRLPALAGVAKELQTVWKDTYIAGLWEKCLIAHLGWHRAGRIKSPSNSSLDSKEYLAPTWSWVSFNGPVLFDAIEVGDKWASLDRNAQLMGYEITPITTDAPLGRLQKGHIEIHAATAKVTHPPSKQVLTFWEISMDKIDTSGTNTVLYALLGFTKRGRAVGLMLMAAETAKYKRIGQFKSKESRWMWSVQNLYPFSDTEVERRTVIII